ncbi:MAG: phosphatase PAP2 family protein [Patescibacteria group bacterium]|nr:phosphatase PAP2 family protein [Patescibacteria group bacterium]
MVTEFIYLFFKDNYKIFIFFDSLRDVFLILILILSLGSIIKDFFSYKKLNKVYLIELILVVILTFSFTSLVKYFYPSIRPFNYFISLSEQKLDSFPSQHTALSFGISFTTLLSNLQLGVLILILSIWIALLSWLSLKHWPIDIFFGIVIGFFTFLLTFWIIQFFFRFYIKKIKS